MKEPRSPSPCRPRPTPAAAPAPLNADEQELAALCKALAHPARVRILRLLAEHDACICGEIVGELPLAQSTVSQHLQQLQAAGLIQGEISGPRSCYCLDRKRLQRLRVLVAGL